jgi:hypothetical protein
MSFFSKIRDFFTGNKMGDVGLDPSPTSVNQGGSVQFDSNSGRLVPVQRAVRESSIPKPSSLAFNPETGRLETNYSNEPVVDNRPDSIGSNPFDNGSIWSAPKAGYEDTTGKYVYDKASHRFVYHKYNNVDNTHRQIDYYTKEIGENGGDLPEPEVNNIYERNPLQKIFAPIDSFGYAVGNLIKGGIEGDSLEETLSNAGKGFKSAFQDTKEAQDYRVGTKEIGQTIMDKSTNLQDQEIGKVLRDNLVAQILGDTLINPTSYIT